MADSAPTPREVAADDLLPPVEPPNEGFVVKLFVVPLLIVLVIVAVYLTFFWLVHLGSDPQQYVDQIEKDNARSWQAAHDLTLEVQRSRELRSDAVLAARLAFVSASTEGGSQLSAWEQLAQVLLASNELMYVD